MNSENLNEIFLKKKTVKMRVKGSFFILSHPDFETADKQHHINDVKSLTGALGILNVLGYNQILLEDENRTIPTGDLMYQYMGVPPRPKINNINNINYPEMNTDMIVNNNKYKYK